MKVARQRQVRRAFRALNSALAGFPAPVYRPFTNQRCPYCDGAHWHVGRASAECGFCDAVLPIARADALA